MHCCTEPIPQADPPLIMWRLEAQWRHPLRLCHSSLFIRSYKLLWRRTSVLSLQEPVVCCRSLLWVCLELWSDCKFSLSSSSSSSFIQMHRSSLFQIFLHMNYVAYLLCAAWIILALEMTYNEFPFNYF